MAASAAMQSFLGSPVTGFSSRTSVRQFVPVSSAPQLPKRANMRVRSMANDDEKENAAPQSASKLKVSTKFEDILAFSGPAPERINGRLAMVGFVTAMGVELANGHDLFSQINDGGLGWFVATSAVLSLASLVPLFKGVRAEAKSGTVMTSDAELWNGRFAMLGLVALAFTEYLKGGALV